MDCKIVRRLRKNLTKLRRQSSGGISAIKLENFAKSLGRTQSNKNWKSTNFSDLTPTAIHHHSAKILPATAGSILDDFDTEVFRLEEKYCHEN